VPTRERIHAAHRAAIEDVIAYAEKRVFATRTGAGGVVSQDIRGVVAVKPGAMVYEVIVRW